MHVGEASSLRNSHVQAKDLFFCYPFPLPQRQKYYCKQIFQELYKRKYPSSHRMGISTETQIVVTTGIVICQTLLLRLTLENFMQLLSVKVYFIIIRQNLDLIYKHIRINRSGLRFGTNNKSLYFKESRLRI
jgi:hypothetical protein